MYFRSFENFLLENYYPNKYKKGIKDKKIISKRRKHFKKQSKLPSNDPNAYGIPPGNNVETKPSKYTKKYHEMFEKLEDSSAEKGVMNKYNAAKEKGGIFSNSEFTPEILREVYRRGMAAWRTGHRPGATQSQWAYARINSFLTKGTTFWTTDRDLAIKANLIDKNDKPSKNVNKPKKYQELYEDNNVYNSFLDYILSRFKPIRSNYISTERLHKYVLNLNKHTRLGNVEYMNEDRYSLDSGGGAYKSLYYPKDKNYIRYTSMVQEAEQYNNFTILNFEYGLNKSIYVRSKPNSFNKRTILNLLEINIISKYNKELQHPINFYNFNKLLAEASEMFYKGKIVYIKDISFYFFN